MGQGHVLRESLLVPAGILPQLPCLQTADLGQTQRLSLEQILGTYKSFSRPGAEHWPCFPAGYLHGCLSHWTEHLTALLPPKLAAVAPSLLSPGSLLNSCILLLLS
jgi:hypothetical protein